MAGDWIKMRGNLWDDPRVSRLCDLCDCGEAQVIGALYWLWATADQHTEDGILPGMSLRQIDRKTGVQGFGQALCAIGWLADNPEGVRIVRFDEHNGTSAKRRSLDAQRKANVRKVSACDADKPPTDTGHDDDETRQVVELEKEKSREEIGPKGPSSPDEPPTAAEAVAGLPCPYARIVELYHERLPDLPRVKLMPKTRQRALRKLWGWVLSSKKSDGSRRATSADEAMAWLAGYFARAAENDFLMGRTPRSGEHANWRCDLDFLLTDKGMRHVIEKTQEAA